MKLKTKEMALCAMMAVVMCVCSWVSIPAAVPFTMQTFGVFCTLLLLGPRLGLWTIVLYLFMGLVGLPVFSGFKGGPAVLLGATGGYILGFLLMAVLYRFVPAKKLVWKLLLLILGLALCYAFGTAWFMKVYTGENKGLMWALGMCVFPFILPDLLKLGLAAVVYRLLSRHLKLEQ